jgi:hypothetical protein
MRSRSRGRHGFDFEGEGFEGFGWRALGIHIIGLGHFVNSACSTSLFHTSDRRAPFSLTPHRGVALISLNFREKGSEGNAPFAWRCHMSVKNQWGTGLQYFSTLRQACFHKFSHSPFPLIHPCFFSMRVSIVFSLAEGKDLSCLLACMHLLLFCCCCGNTTLRVHSAAPARGDSSISNCQPEAGRLLSKFAPRSGRGGVGWMVVGRGEVGEGRPGGEGGRCAVCGKRRLLCCVLCAVCGSRRESPTSPGRTESVFQRATPCSCSCNLYQDVR